MKLRDTLWIWGQDPGSHHHTHDGNIWNLPGENRMTPVEGCEYLGISNCFRVVMGGNPVPPFDDEATALDGLDHVVWSLIGDSGSDRNDDETDLEEIIRIAGLHPNITGGIMDDFMNPKRMKIFTPDRLASFRDRLHTALGDRELSFWNVLYSHELDEKIVPYLEPLDKITLWVWNGKDLPALEEHYARLRELAGPEKSIYAGCYLWDYGGAAPMPMDWMQYQLETYLQWFHDGKIDGIIFCSNTICDIGLETAEYTRDWITAHRDEER